MAAEAHENAIRARGAELLLAAFHQARESGKEDWRAMTTAVLKNRLLVLTDGAFNEADWGASTVTDFVSQFPELVKLDRATRPATVRLAEAAEPHPSERPALIPLGPHRRVRRDLWNAVLDFRGDPVYVWDGAYARPIPSGDVGAEHREQTLPSLTREEFASWRAEFVAGYADVSPPARAALETWRDEELPTRSLPPRFRNVWTAEIKRRVVERLIAWFEAKSIAPPADLVETREPEQPHGSAEELRDFVVRCVEAMTREELEALPLPAGVVARVRR